MSIASFKVKLGYEPHFATCNIFTSPQYLMYFYKSLYPDIEIVRRLSLLHHVLIKSTLDGFIVTVKKDVYQQP